MKKPCIAGLLLLERQLSGVRYNSSELTSADTRPRFNIVQYSSTAITAAIAATTISGGDTDTYLYTPPITNNDERESPNVIINHC
jgi:hypothetical protein